MRSQCMGWVLVAGLVWTAGCGQGVCDRARARVNECLAQACTGPGQPFLCDHREQLDFEGCPSQCERNFQEAVDETDCTRVLNHFSNTVSICVNR